jgi:hypothetical protein
VLSYLAQAKEVFVNEEKFIVLFFAAESSFISNLNWIFPDFSMSTFLKLYNASTLVPDNEVVIGDVHVQALPNL